MNGIIRRLRPNRKIIGMSAILLPFQTNGEIDWLGFHQHVERTRDAGLTPAINMDTGYGPLIDPPTRHKALSIANDIMAGEPFIAGAFVPDQPGDCFQREEYLRRIDEITSVSGTPILFQSYGLAHQAFEAVVENYRSIAESCDRFYAFELGTMFAPFGKIYTLDLFRELVKIPECVGLKHSSLSRELEWQRLDVRDELRPEFQLLTGNDLAIDMVMYGSDYLLGLSTFCPELFAKRDKYWENGDPAFYELNDTLQYLGQFAFRHPTSAYKHDAAMFLHLQGKIETDRTHPESPVRPPSDREALTEIGRRLGYDM